jgi:hypothetical protein
MSIKLPYLKETIKMMVSQKFTSQHKNTEKMPNVCQCVRVYVWRVCVEEFMPGAVTLCCRCFVSSL